MSARLESSFVVTKVPPVWMYYWKCLVRSVWLGVPPNPLAGWPFIHWIRYSSPPFFSLARINLCKFTYLHKTFPSRSTQPLTWYCILFLSSSSSSSSYRSWSLQKSRSISLPPLRNNIHSKHLLYPATMDQPGYRKRKKKNCGTGSR